MTTILAVASWLTGSCISAELLGYWLHRLLHGGIFGFLSRNHMRHHMVLGALQRHGISGCQGEIQVSFRWELLRNASLAALLGTQGRVVITVLGFFVVSSIASCRFKYRSLLTRRSAFD